MVAASGLEYGAALAAFTSILCQDVAALAFFDAVAILGASTIQGGIGVLGHRLGWLSFWLLIVAAGTLMVMIHVPHAADGLHDGVETYSESSGGAEEKV